MFGNSEKCWELKFRSSSYANKGSPWYSVNLVYRKWFNCHQICKNDLFLLSFFLFLCVFCFCLLVRRHFKARRKSLALVDLLCYCSRWVLLLRIKGSRCPRPLYTISSCKIDRVKSLSCHGGVFLPLERIGWTEHDQTAG